MHRKTLRLVYEKTGGRCWYCATFHRPFDNWQIEHQLPRARGGSDDLGNLVLACQECNVQKGKKTVDEYRRALQGKLENRISEAREVAGEIEAHVGWAHHLESPSEGVFPPLWLAGIESLLQEAAEKTVNADFAFYGEILAGFIAPASDPIQESESIV